MNASLNTPAVMHEASTTPLRALYACACLLLMLMVVGDASVLFNLRESALRSKQANSGTVSLTLAEQADRSMQGIDLVLGSLADQFARDGVTDPASFAAKLSGHETHIQLLEKLTGLPYINAIALISVDGRLINFSRYWPIPDIGLSDRSYFKAMIADPQASGRSISPAASMVRTASSPDCSSAPSTCNISKTCTGPSRSGATARSPCFVTTVCCSHAIHRPVLRSASVSRISRRRRRTPPLSRSPAAPVQSMA